MTRQLWLILLVLPSVLGTTPASADELTAANGERFIGSLVAETADGVIFESQSAGRITVPRSRIRQIRRTPAPAVSPAPPGPTDPGPAPAVSSAGLGPTLQIDGRFDWIQLKSGEWLKGRLKAMQNEKLEFDSEKLELQTFDWKDVYEVHSAHTNRLMLESGTTRQVAEGRVRVSREEVAVGQPGQEVTYPRKQVTAITPGHGREWNNWSGKASAGLTVRAGNTEQLDATAHASLWRRTPGTRLSLDYLGNFSRLDSQVNANDHRASAEFDYWLSRRFFVRVPYIEYFRDPFQNLDHRLTVGGGVGYDLVDRPHAEWNVTLGPAYQHNWFGSVEAGESSNVGGAALVFGTRFDWNITKKIELILEYRGQYTRREIGNTTHHGVATIEFELTKRLDLDVSFLWDRISEPAPTSSGAEPKPDDFRLILGLGLYF
jgi:putative salt-induced outer membrane protein YdiY